jgi:hypothetical protein
VSYGSVAGVEAYVRHIAGAAFSVSTKPTLTEVQAFLDQRSAILDGWLAQQGYAVPVTQANALLVLANFANAGAACDVELTQRAAGYSPDDQNRRENKFCAQFMKAEAYIESGALAALGVPTVGAPGPLAGLSVGGVTSGGLRLRPVFKRTSLGNKPDAESPPGREADYTGDP